MRRTILGVLALALLVIGFSHLAAATTASDLRIGKYVLVKKVRIGPLHWQLSYQASLTNRGTTGIPSATAKLRAFRDILIVDGQLSFGPVAAGRTVTSMDTFTLRWPIAKAIDSRILESLLRWDIKLSNAAPIADAGPDQTVSLGSVALLDGSGSSDADGDPLTYRWAVKSRPAGSNAALIGADTTTPTLSTDLPGHYDIDLIVNDGLLDSVPDTVRISTGNSTPVADAGSDQTVFVGSIVTLDGTASSDVDGDPISYQWSFTSKPAGSLAVLSDPTASRPGFTVDRPGDYFIQLIVNDGITDSPPDSVQISTRNSAPLADAGPDQTVFVKTTVELDGSRSSDADGDALAYRWSLLSKPQGSTAVLANDQSVSPSFTVDEPGSYTVQVLVNDGSVDGQPDSMVVSTQNSRPVADAGADQAAIVGDTVTLDGNGSQDDDGDTLSFEWSLITQPASSTAALVGGGTATPTFVPDQPGDYVAQLIVNDGQVASSPETALVSVSEAPPPPNQDPQITSAAVTTGQSGSLYSYQVIADDPDGDPLSYTLTTFPAGMTISAGGLVEWTPASAGDVGVTLEASDGRGGIAEQSFTIQVTSGPGPGVPPPTVQVDTTVLPEVTQIPGFDGGPARPVVALTDRSGILTHFVENELIVVSDDTAAVSALATRWGGTLVRSFVPGDFGLPGAGQHLVRIDTSSVDPSQLVADLQALEPAASSDLRVSNQSGLNVLAAAARESATGTTAVLNLVMLPATIETRITTENATLGMCPGGLPTPPPGNDGCVWPGIPIPNTPTANSESFNSNAFAWSYMMAGGAQNIGVGEAWRSLSLAGLLGNKVTIAVIDSGFSDLAVDNPAVTAYFDNPALTPSGYPPGNVPCTNGVVCPWHGANVVSAAMGPVDDGKGAAGPAGPIAEAFTIRRSTDVFSTALGYGVAFLSPARIVNMSFGARVPATLSWVNEPLNALTAAAYAGGKILIASAGNNNADIDSEDCVPVIGTPCWEDAWYSPCENDGVICVGALAGNDTARASFSNWGSEQVDIFGPGIVWVGGDPADPEPHAVGGTSVAAPFVAGVAALVIAADPTLSNTAVEQILMQTAFGSSDANVQRYVNARGAVNLALGGSPVCTPPQILTQTPSHSTAPCLQNDFEVTHTQAFGPFRYQWRRLVPGTTTRVDLADGGNVSGSTTDHMSLNPFLPADEGSYDVVISNLCGSTTSGLVTVSLVDGALQRAPSLPEGRDKHAMAFDRGRNRMVLYGGSTPKLFGALTLLQESNETWERDGNGVWTVVTDQGPGRRAGAAMAYDEQRGVSVLFGGAVCGGNALFCPWGSPNGPVYYTDTWEYDGTTWTEKPTTFAPSFSVRHSMTYDSVRQRVVMYGGDDRSGFIGNTLFEWDGTTWTPRATAPDPMHGYPPPVLPSPFAFDRTRNVYVLYLYWDTWELDAAGQWHRRAVHGDRNVANSGIFGFAGAGTMVFDSDRGRTLLYTTICSPTACEAALWEWTGSTWGRKAVPALLLPRGEDFDFAYDSGRRRTVMAGGYGQNFLNVLADVVEWRYFVDDPTCSLGPQ